MAFSKLEIKNFRSIDDSGIIIEFPTGHSHFALIGANNCGKSNILDALALVLGVRSGKFYNYELQITDFHNQEQSTAFLIKLTLNSPIEARNVYQQKYYVDGFYLEAKAYSIGDDKGRVHLDHYCFGRNNKGQFECPLMENERIYKQKKNKADDDIDNQRKPIPAKAHLSKVGYVYFLDIEHLDSFFKVSGFGPLGRLFQIYRDEFQTEGSVYRYKDGDQEKEIPSKEAYKRAAERLVDVLRTSKLQEIERSLAKNISEYLGINNPNASKLQLGLPSHDEIFERITRLEIKESEKLEPIEIAKLGKGYLSLFRLAALDTLAQIKEREHSIFIIEEPEIYLHPHLRRHCYRTLKKLAERGSLVTYATHSEEFVELNEYKSIIRLSKPADTTHSHQVDPKETLDFNKMRQKVRRMGNQELLFARYALLTEGQDDHAVYQATMDKAGIDSDAQSISVIDCDGKTQMPDYIRLCRALGIKYFVIYDTDKGNNSSKSQANKILTATNNDKNVVHALPDTLEAALKTTKQTQDNWQHLLSIIDPLSFNQIQIQFPELHQAVSIFLNSI